MWVQNKTAGYKDCAVSNFGSSFHSGLPLCALIHKFRPQLINYAALDKANKLANIKAAMDAAEKYFGLEQYLTPQDFLKLDENGMMVYVSEYFYGIAEQRKIDQAARRILKVVRFTKTCDAMRAEFKDQSTKFKERLAKVEKVLEDRTIDDTMAGAKRKLEEFYRYKTEDKNLILGYQLTLESLYNNLAMLLAHNKRPEFVPPPGLSLKDIEAAVAHLEQVEQERKVALHAELNRQIKLVKLDEHHQAIAARLEAYAQAKEEYLRTKEQIESIGAAQFALKTLDAFDAESAALVPTTIAQLKKLGAELVRERYERKAEVLQREQSIDAHWATMAQLSAQKRPVLEDDLAREVFREELRQKGVQHADRHTRLVTTWYTEKAEYLAAREEITCISEAQVALGKLQAFANEKAETTATAVAALKALGQEILTAKYETQYSSHVFPTPDEITGRENDIDTKWAELDAAAAEKRAYLDECLAREQRKEELRLEFARLAHDLERWVKDTCENLAVAMFGFTLEEVEAYAAELEQSENAINTAVASKKAAYEAVWADMQAMNFSDNPYTQLTVEQLAEFEAQLAEAL